MTECGASEVTPCPSLGGDINLIIDMKSDTCCDLSGQKHSVLKSEAYYLLILLEGYHMRWG